MGLPDVPVHVTAIKLHGNKRTKAEVILAAVCDVEKASTAQELLERLAVARANLSQLGIFESAEILVDTHSGREVGTGALDTKLVVDVKEKKHFEMKLETGIDPNAGKGSAEASVTMTNRFGRAERIFASSTQNASHGMTRDYKAGFFLPSMINSVGGISADISQTNAAYPRCSYDEEVSELTMRAGLPALPLLGQQTVWAGVAMRQLSAGAESSFKIKEQCSSAFSTSTKCFLGYTLQHDDRDDAQMPTDGSAWRCSIEAAAKDVAFIKPELKFQYNRPISQALGGVSMHCSAAAGVIQRAPWAGAADESRCVRISDRFFLGNPRVRGFRTKGVGPWDTRAGSDPKYELGDALGGDLHTCGSLALSCPLPTCKLPMSTGARLQCFANAGSNIQMNEPGVRISGADVAKHLAERMCSAVGAGVVCTTPYGRLEVNLCYTFGLLPGLTRRGSPPKSGMDPRIGIGPTITHTRNVNGKSVAREVVSKGTAWGRPHGMSAVPFSIQLTLSPDIA